MRHPTGDHAHGYTGMRIYCLERPLVPHARILCIALVNSHELLLEHRPVADRHQQKFDGMSDVLEQDLCQRKNPPITILTTWKKHKPLILLD